VASDPQEASDGILVQFTNGDLRRFVLTDDPAHHVWSVRDNNGSQAGNLTYGTRPDGVVSLTGRIGGDSLDIQLRPVDPKLFSLLGP
jgi:hypothetical protein